VTPRSVQRALELMARGRAASELEDFDEKFFRLRDELERLVPAADAEAGLNAFGKAAFEAHVVATSSPSYSGLSRGSPATCNGCCTRLTWCRLSAMSGASSNYCSGAAPGALAQMFADARYWMTHPDIASVIPSVADLDVELSRAY